MVEFHVILFGGKLPEMVGDIQFVSSPRPGELLSASIHDQAGLFRIMNVVHNLVGNIPDVWIERVGDVTDIVKLVKGEDGQRLLASPKNHQP